METMHEYKVTYEIIYNNTRHTRHCIVTADSFSSAIEIAGKVISEQWFDIVNVAKL